MATERVRYRIKLLEIDFVQGDSRFETGTYKIRAEVVGDVGGRYTFYSTSKRWWDVMMGLRCGTPFYAEVAHSPIGNSGVVSSRSRVHIYSIT